MLNAIPEAEWSKELKDLSIEDEELPTERCLGLQWNAQVDKFTFKICQKEKPLTRRGMLSIASSVYDPIGFASPFVLKAKIILHPTRRTRITFRKSVNSFPIVANRLQVLNFVILSLLSLFRSPISFTISFTLGYSSLSCILVLSYLLLF